MRTLPRSHWEPPRPLQQGRSCEVSCPGCLVVFGPSVHISPQALGTGAATALPGTAAQPSPSAEGFGEVRAQPAPGEGAEDAAASPAPVELGTCEGGLGRALAPALGHSATKGPGSGPEAPRPPAKLGLWLPPRASSRPGHPKTPSLPPHHSLGSCFNTTFSSCSLEHLEAPADRDTGPGLGH